MGLKSPIFFPSRQQKEGVNMKWCYSWGKTIKEDFVTIRDNMFSEPLAEICRADITAWDKEGETIEFFRSNGHIEYDYIFSVELNTLEAVNFLALWCQLEGYAEKVPTDIGYWEYSEDTREWTKK
jgi:hypothetical protein